jgi:tetratricopeptide (TPR) repeat protein
MFRLTATLIITLALMTAVVRADSQWTWELPVTRLKGVNAFERAQYTKAAGLLRGKNHKAAASEFEKMKVQFPDSELVPYAAFMQGYSLHMAKQRNQASKLYTEVLDFFGDEIDVAAPALYFLGVAHMDNGDTRKGLECFQELADDADYAEHPVAAGAFHRLGNAHWTADRRQKAVAAWKRAATMEGVNRNQARPARARAVQYYLGVGDMTGYEAWRITEKNQANSEHRRRVAVDAVEQAWYVYDPRNAAFYAGKASANLPKHIAAFLPWYAAQKSWFKKDRELWDYHAKLLWLLSWRHKEKTALDAAVDQTLAFMQEMPDKKERDRRLAWVVDRLRDCGRMMRAEYVTNQMTNRAHAAYKQHELLARQKKYADAVARLVQAEALGDEVWTRNSKRARAAIYKDHMGKYDDAIAVYLDLDDPPWSLWQMQHCEWKAKRTKKALAILTEIEAMFPKDAPNAAWYKTHYLHESGQKESAIAGARRILKKYKKSQAASHAHQLLEKYGVQTGGGVFDDE